jgi:hypothetical protein
MDEFRRHVVAFARPYIDSRRCRPLYDVPLAHDPFLALLIAMAIVSNLWDVVVQVPRNR